ncbi:MAG: ABC transporter substrate-binding protein [Deltaproteobacteria bacterium]|nr:MAG: ABC transporter substrate-binding protein [Deltaproteobacteria bacterium]
MFTSRRILRQLVLAIVISVLFYDPAWAADRLRIGYGAPSVAMSMLWITKEGKLFEKNGLDVEVLYLESALVQRALIAGNIDYGEMTGSLMAAPKLQGADLVMVAGFLNQLIYRLVTRPEIKTIADLKGKRVAVSRFGAGADRATRFLLTKLGFNPEKDVVLIQVGGAPTRLAALAANSIDATIVEPPDHKKAQEAGMRVLANMEEMGIPFQHTGLVTTRAHLAKSPDIARRVMKSFVEAAAGTGSRRCLPDPARLHAEKALSNSRRLQNGFRRTGRTNSHGKNRRPQGFRRHSISRRVGSFGLYRRTLPLNFSIHWKVFNNGIRSNSG